MIIYLLLCYILLTLPKLSIKLPSNNLSPEAISDEYILLLYISIPLNSFIDFMFEYSARYSSSAISISLSMVISVNYVFTITVFQDPNPSLVHLCLYIAVKVCSASRYPSKCSYYLIEMHIVGQNRFEPVAN